MSKSLFCKQAVWFAEDSGMTLSQFLNWVTSYLKDLDKGFLEKMLPFLDKEQVEAEKLLCQLLSKDFRTPRKTRTVSSLISRRTNWPRTYQKAFPLIPSKYHNTLTANPLDIAFMGALAGIAEEWAIWLENILERCSGILSKDKLKNRSEKLNRAVKGIKGQGVRPTYLPLTPQQRQAILRHIPADKHKLFQKSLRRWQSYSSKTITKKYVDQLWKLIDDLSGNGTSENNLDFLFEATCHLCILRTAKEENWQFEHEALLSNPPINWNNPPYRLRNKEGLHLILGKGNPYKLLADKHPYGKSDEKSDRMLGLRQLSVCAEKATGYQPDIVMGFYHDHPNDPENNLHVVFGDAKRYEYSDIAGAYKETVASTMIAYGHWGKLSIKPCDKWQDAFESAVNPFFTLFYMKKEGGGTVINPGKHLEKDKVPPVLAFEFEDMNQADSGEPSEALKMWFKRLEEQVDTVLK